MLNSLLLFDQKEKQQVVYKTAIEWSVCESKFCIVYKIFKTNSELKQNLNEIFAYVPFVNIKQTKNFDIFIYAKMLNSLVIYNEIPEFIIFTNRLYLVNLFPRGNQCF